MGRREMLDFSLEVHQRFGFLADDFGMDGPEPGIDVYGLDSAYYKKPGFVVSVQYQVGDGAPSVETSLFVQTGPFVGLAEVVEAARFTPKHKVMTKAHSTDAILASLDNQSLWLRRLMPLLIGDDVSALLEAARAHPVDRAGNPRRRAPNIKWRWP